MAALTRATIVLSVASQKLRTILDSYARGYGTTPSGKDWCIKALHPSDPITEVRGIPDRSAVPSAFLNYQSTYTLGPASGAVGTWGFSASLLPHPINFMYVNVDDSTGHFPSNFMNTQLAGVTHQAKLGSFLSSVRRWRLAYMSVTVYQDGPDLANQGTLVCAQLPLRPLVFHTVGMLGGSPAIDCAASQIHAFENTDLPDFETLQAMPSAYFGRSREGCYVPLKLTKTCQHWHSLSDMAFMTDTLIDPSTFGATRSVGYYPMPFKTSPNNAVFPHTNLEAVYTTHDDSSGYGFFGLATSPLCNDTVAHFAARNLALTTSFSFFVRCGFEIQVQPTSIYSTHLKLSPPHDPVAMESYFAIARELKDAYPADHNDLGKIWDVISTVAKTVAPGLALIPGVGGPISAAVTGVARAGDAIRAAVSRGKKAMVPRSSTKDRPSPADVELARAVVAARRARPAAPPRRQGRRPSNQRKPKGGSRRRSLSQ